MKHITYHTSGYRLIYSPTHLRANAQGYVSEHVLVCEKVLGKPLPNGAEPHHVDGVKSNNVNSNLVLCQDRDYHALIERRTRALNACGHANWRKCPYCKKWDDSKNMHIYEGSGRKAYHVDCSTIRNKTKRELKRENQSEILCACGCGRSFKPRRKIDRFFSKKCRNHFHNNLPRNQEKPEAGGRAAGLGNELIPDSWPLIEGPGVKD